MSLSNLPPAFLITVSTSLDDIVLGTMNATSLTIVGYFDASLYFNGLTLVIKAFKEKNGSRAL